METLKRVCPNCGAAMERQHPVWFSDPLAATRKDMTKADLYLCPDCGKIEFYAADKLKLSDLFSSGEDTPK